jgi:hypothetical protein
MIHRKEGVYHIEFAKSIYTLGLIDVATHDFSDAGHFVIGDQKNYPYYVVKFRPKQQYADDDDLPYAFINHVLACMKGGNA